MVLAWKCDNNVRDRSYAVKVHLHRNGPHPFLTRPEAKI